MSMIIILIISIASKKETIALCPLPIAGPAIRELEVCLESDRTRVDI